MGTYIVIAIAIIFFIVRIAANKKAKAENERNNTGEEGQYTAPPPPVSTMSDIQKAFMMMSGQEPEKAPPAAYNAPVKTTDAGVFSSPEGRASHEGRAGKTEGRAGKHEGTSSHEGRAGKHEGREFHAPGFHSASNKYQSIDLNSYKGIEDKPDKYKQTLVKPKKSSLKLFEDKDDYFKAVVYSEILKRKAR